MVYDNTLELDPIVPEQKKKKEIKADVLLQGNLLSLIVLLVFYIVISLVTSDKAAGMFLFPLLTILAGYLLFHVALVKPFSVMVMHRLQRGHVLDLPDLLRRMFRLSLILGVLLSVGLYFFGYYGSMLFFEAKSVFMGMLIAALTFFLFSLQTVPVGFLSGTGNGGMVVVADVIRTAFSVICGIACAIVGGRYGTLTDALLRTQTGVYAYVSLGAAFGIFTGVVASGIYLVIVYIGVKRKVMREMEDSIRTESEVSGVFVRCIPYMVSALLPVLMLFFGIVLYVLLVPLQTTGLQDMERFGDLFARALFPMLAIGLIIPVFFVRGGFRLGAMVSKNDLGSAHSLYRHLRFFLVYYSLPVAALCGVFSESAIRLLNRYPDKEVVMAARISAVYLLTIPMIVFGTLLFLRLRKGIILYFNATITMIVYAVLLFALVKGASYGVLGAFGAGAVAFLIWDALLFFTIGVMFGIRLRFMKDVGKFLIAAVIAGALGFALNAILLPVIGEILTIVIGGTIGFAFYFIVLIILRAISVPELYHLPLGDRLVPLLRGLHLIV